MGALVELFLSDLHAHMAKLLQPCASGPPLLMARGPVKGSENVRAINQIHSAHIQEDLRGTVVPSGWGAQCCSFQQGSVRPSYTINDENPGKACSLGVVDTSDAGFPVTQLSPPVLKGLIKWGQN